MSNKLLSDIINELVDDSVSLQRPLLKMKVLATRIDNSELLDWVNTELTGYVGDGIEVPNYRRTLADITGSYINGRHKVNNAPLPCTGLPEKLYDFLTYFEVISGIQAIEMGVLDNKTGYIELQIPFEIQKKWRQI